MKNIFWIVLSLGSLNGSALIENKIMQENTTNDQAAVLAAVRQLAQLMIARDTVSMNNILGEHYTLTHMTGYVQSKSEWFGEVHKETMKYYSAQEVEHNVKVIGNQAEVTVKNRVDARIWGSRNTWRLQQKVQLEKRDGKWIILKSVASTF